MFVLLEDRFIIGGVSSEEVEDDASEFMGGGGDGFGCAEAGAEAAEVIADGGVAFAGAICGHAKGGGGAAFDVTGVSGEDFAAGDAVIRREAEPGAEVFGGGKL